MTSARQKPIPASRAAVLLGVKPATLYAYVSRGLIKPVGKDGKRQSLFRPADVEKLKARSRARKGRGAVAADALHWGDPVLDSSITKITSEGPVYRGYLALELADGDVSFERVCELIWSGVLPDGDLTWEQAGARWQGETTPLSGGFSGVFVRMMEIGSRKAAALSGEDQRFDRQLEAARALIHGYALYFSYRYSNGRLHKPDHSVAGLLAVPANKNFQLARRLINRALVVCADHELTASTFVTRVAASTGSEVIPSVVSAFGAMSGRQHGAHFAVIKDDLARLARLNPVLLRRELQSGELPAGFHHTLYPDGDPRSLPLLALFSEAGETSEEFRFMLQICEQVRKRGIRAPSIDMALLMLCSLLEIPEDFAAVLFGIGRLAGLFAHYQEQRMSGFMVRPRARYAGR
jgi:citrate synthase